MARARWLRKALRSAWYGAAWVAFGLLMAYGLLWSVLAPLGQ